MIGEEDFKKLIKEFNEQNKLVDKLNEVFDNSFSSPIIDYGFKMFDKVISLCFDEVGKDWISYYLYENPEKRYYLNDTEIPLETVDDLWKIIEGHRI